MAIYCSPDKKGINQRKKVRLIHKVCGGNVKVVGPLYICDRCHKYVQSFQIERI